MPTSGNKEPQVRNTDCGWHLHSYQKKRTKKSSGRKAYQQKYDSPEKKNAIII
jgi:hypothetical protein